MATLMTQREIHRRRRRARERGAAVFIVVLLVAMLTAIGFFAAHSASLSTQSGGHVRQSTQARYLAEFAMQVAVSDFEERGQVYVQQAVLNPDSRCDGVTLGDPCFIVGKASIDQLIPPAEGLLAAPVSPAPGSLGWSNLGWEFEVHETDIMPAVPPPSGYDETSAGAVNLRPMRATLQARVVLIPPAGGMTQDQVIAAAGIQERMSAHVIINNVPKF
jgi:hypothetical protein